MITYALSVRRSHVSLRVFLVAGLLLLSVAAIANPAAPETRLSITTQGSRADIDSGSSGVTSTDEFDGLSVEGERSTNKSSTTLSKSGFTTSAATNSDFWFYTADVELFNDHDRDGFFHGIDLYFDADTYYSYAEVYAVVYLSQEGGPWSEYAVTENFTLYGATSEDDYVIATELLSGYPSGSYDLLGRFIRGMDRPRGHPGAGISAARGCKSRCARHDRRYRRQQSQRRRRSSLAFYPASCAGCAGEKSPRATRMTLRPQPARLSK